MNYWPHFRIVLCTILSMIFSIGWTYMLGKWAVARTGDPSAFSGYAMISIIMVPITGILTALLTTLYELRRARRK